MAYRILVDENTSPRVAASLREHGHDAIHVTKALTASATDEAIHRFAVETDAVVLTHDDDFLREDHWEDVRVLYYADDTLAASAIVEQVLRVIEFVPDQADLPPVTNLGRW